MQQNIIGKNTILRHYIREHYRVLFDRESGLFIRFEEEGYPEPFWSQHGPELLDISITNWCDRCCSFCYRKSNLEGAHMALEDYELIMQQAQEIGVLQVALGGGNPNQHPDFIKILSLTRQKYDIVPSYTTNGRGLSKEVLEASKENCGAVALSAYEPYDEFRRALDLLLRYTIKTNVHFLVTNKTIDRAITWLQNVPHYLNAVNAVIFLNYKPMGREQNYSLLLNRSHNLRGFFKLASAKEYPFKIGFDSCSISGIVKYMDVNPMFYEACEAARFSAFVSENLTMLPCSFMCDCKQQPALRDARMVDIWQNSTLFRGMRNKLAHNNCKSCEYTSSCLGGCPLTPDINLCQGQ